MPYLADLKAGYFPRHVGGVANAGKGRIFNAYPYTDGASAIIGTGGSWLVIKFASHDMGEIIVPKIVHSGSGGSDITSGIGIVPGGIQINGNVGMLMAIQL